MPSSSMFFTPESTVSGGDGCLVFDGHKMFRQTFHLIYSQWLCLIWVTLWVVREEVRKHFSFSRWSYTWSQGSISFTDKRNLTH